MFKLAHFSDIHYTLPPFGFGLRALLSKRIVGISSYYVTGRGEHFADTTRRIPLLLADVDAQNVDHVICTGDLSAVAAREELDGVAGAFGARLSAPARYTVIPGNHDRYVQDALSRQLFEKHFAPLCEGGVFPFQKRVGPVRIVGIDVCRPTNFKSSGWCGPEQRAALKTLLAPSLKGELTILVLHYGLLRPGGERDTPNHRIEDDLELLALLDSDDVAVDLVLHGHMHRSFNIKSEKRRIICAGSATDLHLPCGYNVYAIDAAARSLVLDRRAWNGSAYEAGERQVVSF
jgi:3',5'-cyclic AMP phosphodiesterase CpdA